ncbi:MICOS complex subunit MIC13 [Apis mellifera caucasica]|uniref:MICOS complex subunit MIC13 n=1 Tax=Apis mellifera TaxID=7460 RepID=A0A7M7G9K9_APIME|nr:MICOS complex subunit MIC13 [Apis mellifera]KAG6799070.1 MICOS complex subunit MIC13 [Apis mellifera caucasica]KAG9432322.1 MICOS complex subunit MIC13 [Apis mellifera carnica]|eukprot:XP_003250159.1 MICOS complex subunit MIC13 [Apis mellifera]
MNLIRFVIKSSIVGGIVYYTYKEGLWSKSEETAALYKKLNVKIAPYVKENVPEKITKEISQLPSVTDITNFIKVTWNKGVMSSMGFISNLPTHTFNSATSLYETTQSYIKELSV